MPMKANTLHWNVAYFIFYFILEFQEQSTRKVIIV